MATAAALDEPHLAKILDWGSDRWNQHEARFVTVEQLAGGSLRDVLDRGRTLSPSQTLSVGLDVLRALDVVHRAGLVHGDVRPSTIVFGADGVPRLIDVGLGQLLGAGAVGRRGARQQRPGDVRRPGGRRSATHRIVPEERRLLAVPDDARVRHRAGAVRRRVHRGDAVEPDEQAAPGVGRPRAAGRRCSSAPGDPIRRAVRRWPSSARRWCAPPSACPARRRSRSPAPALFDLDEAEATRQPRPPGRRPSRRERPVQPRRRAVAAAAGAAAIVAATAACRRDPGRRPDARPPPPAVGADGVPATALRCRAAGDLPDEADALGAGDGRRPGRRQRSVNSRSDLPPLLSRFAAPAGPAAALDSPDRRAVHRRRSDGRRGGRSTRRSSNRRRPCPPPRRRRWSRRRPSRRSSPLRRWSRRR